MKTKFKTTVLQDPGGNATGLQVPPQELARLGTSKKPPVKVTIGKYTYRTTVATLDGKFMLSLSKANREAAGVKAGDKVEVTLELDEEPRTVEVPQDLATALAGHKGARAAFDASSYSVRKEYVRQVESAKTQETRTRRIANIVAKLVG